MESDSISTAEAAKMLGTSPRRVRALVSEGALTASGRLGTMFVLDRRQVVARGRQMSANQGWSATAHTGRRWSEKTAWAAISLLTAGDSPCTGAYALDAAARYRLRRRLSGIQLDRFIWLAGGRARLHTFDGLADDAAHLRADIVPTGVQAAASPTGKEHFDLAAFADDVDGYVSQQQLVGLVAKYSLQPSPSGKFRLRTVSEERINGHLASGVPVVAVALDLLDEGSVRSRSQAEAFLRECLTGFGDGEAP